MSLKHSFTERIWVFVTNSNYIIPIFLQPNDVTLWFFKLRIFEISDFALGWEDIKIGKSDFLTKTQFLFQNKNIKYTFKRSDPNFDSCSGAGIYFLIFSNTVLRIPETWKFFVNKTLIKNINKKSCLIHIEIIYFSSYFESIKKANKKNNNFCKISLTIFFKGEFQILS